MKANTETMKQEDKQLLLKDLCARLPYDNTMIRVEVLDENHAIMKGGTQDDELSIMWVGIVAADNPFHVIKPYLRPMLRSSMTDEERKEYESFFSIGEYACGGSYYGKEYEYIADDYDDVTQSVSLIDWLNSHHFDYRGLIEKGLALEAPEGMYKTE